MPPLLRRFAVAVEPPFSLYYTVRVSQRLAANRVDRWEQGEYRRLIPVGDRTELISVSQTGAAVEAAGRLSNVEVTAAQALLSRMLGASVNLAPFYELIRGNVPLSALARALEGLKPPRYPTLFEALAHAICCQQVSPTVGMMLIGRLAAAAGSSRAIGGEHYTAFPTAEQVLRLKPEQVRAAGFSAAKAGSLALLAEGFATGRYREEEIEALPTAAALDRLLRLPGIGAWSATCVLLRGLGRLDVFPAGDGGAARALGELLGRPMTAAETEAFARHWKEYAGLMYFHLLGHRYLPEQAERLPISRVPVPIRLT